MSDNINNVRIASYVNDMFYDRLRYLSGEDKEDSREFKDIITKLKKSVKVENNEYKKLTNEELLNCLIDIENNKYINPSLLRHFSKLNHELQIREGNPVLNDDLLNDVISTKLLIDVIKRLDLKIQNISNDPEFSEEDVHILNILHRVHKFSYLFSNNYIESLALKHNFDIEKIPRLFFSDIETRYNIEFYKNANPLFLKYATDSIDELLRIDESDEYARAYLTLFEMSRIECIINLLDINTAKELQKYIDYNYIETDILKDIKKLIRKRKEELS